MINQFRNFFKTGQQQQQQLALFKKYYLENRDFIRSAIYWMVRSEEVNDLVQETFVRAWKNFDQFREESSIRTWLYRIAMNVTYDYLKKNESLKDLPINLQSISESDPKLADLIEKGAMTLDEKSREVFALYYRFEYTIAEISEILQIPEGTVKSRLHYGREAFKEFLRANGVSDER